MDIKDFKPGQTVYVLQRERSMYVIEQKVETVGRKYVTLAGSWKEQYFLRHETDNFLVEKREFGCPNYLFASKEECDLFLERENLELKIRRNINKSLGGMSIDQLRQISNWMDNA